MIADISTFGMAVCLGVLLIEEERLAVFDVGLLLEVFGSERGLDVGDWRNLQEEEIYDWRVSPKTD